MQRSRKLALVGALMLPVVAGGFLLQGRVQRQGELLLDQVMSLVSDRFVDTLADVVARLRSSAGVREVSTDRGSA